MPTNAAEVILRTAVNDMRPPLRRACLVVLLVWLAIPGRPQAIIDLEAKPDFVDVPATHPYYSYVQYLRERSIAKGIGANLYDVDRPLTRLQAAALVVRAIFWATSGTTLGKRADGSSGTAAPLVPGYQSATSPYFEDVGTTGGSSDPQLYLEAQKAKELGIINGYSTTRFEPLWEANRGMMIAVSVRAMEARTRGAAWQSRNYGDETKWCFSDVEPRSTRGDGTQSAGHSLFHEIWKAQQMGVIVGDCRPYTPPANEQTPSQGERPSVALNWDQTITRGEAAKYIVTLALGVPTPVTLKVIKREEERATGTWVTTSWAPYDGLNRPTSKSYQGLSPATAAVSYEYDRGGLKGALSGVSSSDATIAYQYDKLGRVRSKVQVTSFGTTTAATNRVVHAMSFQYDLADNLTQMTLPSGRTVTYSRDAIGRLQAISGTLNQTPRTYLSGVQYSAWSRPSSLSYGNGLTEGRAYDSRGWVSGITTVPLKLTPGWYPNGNLNSQRIEVGTMLDVTQTYDYYRPGRLKTATETNTAAPGSQRWSQTFAYDGVGNRSIAANTFPFQGNQPTQFDAATNAPSGGNWNYNKAGLMLRDGSGSEHEYDGEGRLRRFGLAANGTYYTYDGEGRRVMKFESSNGQRTIYVYDAEGELSAEYRTDTVDPSCGAAGSPGCTQFLMADHLGSTRVVTGLNQAVLGRYDYLPFGDELPGWTRSELSGSGYGANLKMGVKYTGQMRDGESGLDYFGARYYSAVQGRFLTPDPENAGAVVEMPQSWHGYAYVMNNPMAYVDPTGLEADSPDGAGGGLCPLDEKTGKEQPCLAGLAYDYFSRRLWFGMQALNYGAKALGWVSQPRDQGCMAAAVGGGSTAGMAAGMLGGVATGGVTIPLTVPTGLITLGTVGYFGGLANCMTGSGSGGGGGATDSGRSGSSSGGLGPAERRKLGDLAGRAGEKVRDVIRSRGGTGSNVNQVGQWADRTLGDAAQAAVRGDRTAETAIKIAKQAASKGQKY